MGLSQAALELLVTLKDEASSGLDSLGGGLGTLGTIAGGAALAGVVAFGAAVAGGAQDAIEARKLLAQTEATIASTGGAAGLTAQQIVDMSSAMSDAAGKSPFGDDAIQRAENTLLTFQQIGKDVFPQATQATLDMAAALKTTPEAMDQLVGKALGVEGGYKALAKSGVTFTEQQQEQIDAMQKAGDMAGAQQIILEQLNKTYGGQAQAAATAAGGMAQFKAGAGEAFETIGAELLPLLDELGAWLTKPEVQEGIKTFSENLANGIRIAADWIKNTLIPAISDFYNWLAPKLGPILAEIGRALSEDLPRGIERVQTGWANLKQAMADFKTNYIDPIVRGWNAIISAITTAYDWFVKIGNAVSSIQIPSWLQGHSPPPLANWFNDIASSAESAGGAVQDVAPPSGSVPSLPTLATAGGGSGGGNVYITVQGSVTTERDLVRAVRDGMNALGRQNTSIFSPDVTP